MSRRTSARQRHDGDAEHPVDESNGAPNMTWDEAAEAYPNEWIFMEVTGRDEHKWPWRGRILAHDRHRAAIDPTVIDVLLRVKETGIAPPDVLGYTVFHGVKLFRSAEEWEEFKRQTGLSGDRRDRRGQ